MIMCHDDGPPTVTDGIHVMRPRGRDTRLVITCVNVTRADLNSRQECDLEFSAVSHHS